jgi:hypothetical protein
MADPLLKLGKGRHKTVSNSFLQCGVHGGNTVEGEVLDDGGDCSGGVTG